MGIISAIAGIGSALIGARSAKKQATVQAESNDKAIEASLMGFNYLKGNENVNAAQAQGLTAQGAVGNALGLTGQGPGEYQRLLGIGQEIASQGSSEYQRLLGIGQALTGLGGDEEAAQAAFQRYQNSTGYQFRLGQGMEAITGGAASRGLLNSGATLKGLNDYGQGAASAEFGNYLGQLQQQSQQQYQQSQQQMNNYQQQLANYQGYLANLMGAQDTGLNAAYNVASSGGTGGANAAQVGMQGAAQINRLRQQGTDNLISGLGSAAGGLKDWWDRRNPQQAASGGPGN